MLDAGDEVAAVAVEVLREREGEARRRSGGSSSPRRRRGRASPPPPSGSGRSSPGRGRSSGGPRGGRALRVDAVETLRVAAREVVDLERLVDDPELVGDLPHRHAVERPLLSLEALARQLEGVVPERAGVRADLLRLLPARSPASRPARRRGRARRRTTSLWPGRSGCSRASSVTTSWWLPLRMAEVVPDSFLLHQPGGEGEVGLAILGAVVAGLVRAADLDLDDEAG